MTKLPAELIIGGFRSLGATGVALRDISKVNVFIGPNNSGKSNILRFVSRFLQPISKRSQIGATALTPADRTTFGGAEPFVRIKLGTAEAKDFLATKVGSEKRLTDSVLHLFDQAFSRTDRIEIEYIRSGKVFEFSKNAAAEFLKRADVRTEPLSALSLQISGSSSDSAENYARIIQYLDVLRDFPGKTVFVPALRTTAKAASPAPIFSERNQPYKEFDGASLIGELARIQNPDVGENESRVQFNNLTTFVRSVLGVQDAQISVPHSGDKIIVEMGGRVLALSHLGSGIEQVIVLGALATVVTDSLVCIEEPEAYLHPDLQNQLIDYVSRNTSNTYFLSTHSSAVIDNENAAIYSCSMSDQGTCVQRIASRDERFSTLFALGYRASDLLQSNCIIWVEGPSDRIYLLHGLKSKYPDLLYGVDYTVMFYGGRLLSRLTAGDADQPDVEHIDLAPINRRSCIVIDSDLRDGSSKISATKIRIRTEFESADKIAVITRGREVENYLARGVVQRFVAEKWVDAEVSEYDLFADMTKVRRPSKMEFELPKIDLAKWAVKQDGELFVDEFWQDIERLGNYISQSRRRRN